MVVNSPGAAFANAITGLTGGDEIEFGNGMTITAAALVNGNTIQVDYLNAQGTVGTYDLTNVNFAPGAPTAFTVGVDSLTGDSYIKDTTAISVAQALADYATTPNMSAVAVSDSAANVAGSLDQLEAMAGAISTIALTNGGTPSLALSYTQYVNDAAVLAKITGNYGLVMSGAPVSAATTLQGSSHVTSFSVSDTAANVEATLSALNSDSKLSSVTVNGTSGSDIVNLAGFSKAVTLNLNGDTASVSAGLSSPSMVFIGTPDIVTLGAGASIVDFALQPSSGIEEIANFQYGLDELVLSLNGAASNVLYAANTTVNGVAAISIYSSADPTHGIILTGMTAGQTAANLLSSHTTFSNGNAIIT